MVAECVAYLPVYLSQLRLYLLFSTRAAPLDAPTPMYAVGWNDHRDLRRPPRSSILAGLMRREEQTDDATTKTPAVEPAEQWDQLELLCTSPEQRVYELIRPIVLFGQPAAERARETKNPQRTVFRHAKLFLEQGMASLCAPPPGPPSPRLPLTIRDAIVAVKAEHPPLYLVMLQWSGHRRSTGSPAAAIGDGSALVGVRSPVSVVARQSRGAAVAGPPVSAWRTHSAGSG